MGSFGPFVLQNLDRTGCQTLVDLASKLPNDLERNELSQKASQLKNNCDLRIALKSMMDLGSGPASRSEKASFAKIERALQLTVAKAESYVECQKGQRDDWLVKGLQLLEIHPLHPDHGCGLDQGNGHSGTARRRCWRRQELASWA